MKDIAEFNKFIKTNCDKETKVTESMIENFNNFVLDRINKLDTQHNNVAQIYGAEFRQLNEKIIREEVFKIAKLLGYDRKESSVLSNNVGFYRQTDALKYIKDDPTIAKTAHFYHTIDPVLLSKGLVPKKPLQGKRGSERKELAKKYSNIILSEFNKSEILKAMVDVSDTLSYKSLSRYFNLIMDRIPKKMIDYIPIAKRRIRMGYSSGFDNFMTPSTVKPWNASKDTNNGSSNNSSVTNLVHNKGIIFIDEIDKLATGKGSVDRDNIGKVGVQRDLLALLDGTHIHTQHGTINTENIIFITAGAFHMNEVGDLMPELLGRLPIHIKLDPMSEDVLLKVIKDTENSPIAHHKLLLKTEGINVIVTDDALDEIAGLSNTINKKYRNMGARTLSTVIERVFSDVSFDAFKDTDEEEKKLIDFTIDKKYVRNIRKEMLKEFNDEYMKRVLKQMTRDTIY